MNKSLKNRILLICALIPMMAFSDGHTVVVPWTGVPGEMESFIHADTTDDGSQAHDVYILESNTAGPYLQLTEVNLHSSCTLKGAPFDESAGEKPATVQPIAGDDGNLQFTGWPQNHVKTHGENQTYIINNILFNGVAYNQTGSLFGVLSTYGVNNTVVVDGVWSIHHNIISYFNFGERQKLHVLNCTATQFTSYGGGMWWGGFLWGGGGGWTGTWTELVVQNNSVEGTMGQVFVIYDNGLVPQTAGDPLGFTWHGEWTDKIIINHNTFVNITDWVKFYRHGNNTHFSNNLFVNTVSTGQTHNSHGQGATLNWAGGHGKMATLNQGACTDSTLLANGWCWDRTNRNIHYNNNGFYDTPELAAMFAMDPWCWDVTDTNGVVTTYCDTMIADQSRWMDDSTTAQMANGVSETDNGEVADLDFNMESIYIQTHVNRNMDWLDNKTHDTHPDSWWLHQADNDWNNVEWPLPMTDFSYSTSSVAYTHAEGGFPIGDLNHFPAKLAEWRAQATAGLGDGNVAPSQFTLSQNYPNPFNPTTEISFSMDKASDVSLTIFNLNGQQVKVIENAYLAAGNHTYRWDGRDQLGQSVSTGVYLYTLTGDKQSITKKMALMK